MVHRKGQIGASMQIIRPPKGTFRQMKKQARIEAAGGPKIYQEVKRIDQRVKIARDNIINTFDPAPQLRKKGSIPAKR
jgi:hypothetical protein